MTTRVTTWEQVREEIQGLREDLLSGRRDYPAASWDVYGQVYRVADPGRVRIERAVRGISRRDLAERIGVHASWIERVEVGTRALMGAELVMVAEALEVEVSALVNMTADPVQVRRARVTAGLSQARLAALVGQSEDWARALERGERAVEPGELIAVAKMLKVPVSELTASETGVETGAVCS